MIYYTYIRHTLQTFFVSQILRIMSGNRGIQITTQCTAQEDSCAVSIAGQSNDSYHIWRKLKAASASRTGIQGIRCKWGYHVSRSVR